MSFLAKLQNKHQVKCASLKHDDDHKRREKNYYNFVGMLADKAWKMLMRGASNTVYLVYVPAGKGSPDVDIISDEEKLSPGYAIAVSLNGSYTRERIYHELIKHLGRLPIYVG